MTIVSEDGRFEWDSAKDNENRRKHLLSFEEILDVFDDPAFWRLMMWITLSSKKGSEA